jgi:hypothetical protein
MVGAALARDFPPFFPNGRIGELGLFLGQQTLPRLAPRLVGLLGQQAPVMLDIQLGHGAVHGARSSLVSAAARTIRSIADFAKRRRGTQEARAVRAARAKVRLEAAMPSARARQFEQGSALVFPSALSASSALMGAKRVMGGGIRQARAILLQRTARFRR